MDLLALESRRGLCFLGWSINQLIGFFLLLRLASSECPCGPLQPRVANRTAVYWTCILWPAASYSCQMVWKTSTVSYYSASRNNGWLFISLWKWLSFCFSKTVVTSISCKLKWQRFYILEKNDLAKLLHFGSLSTYSFLGTIV